jgi:hypothetical protein
MRISELKKEIDRVTEKHELIAESLAGADNPQIKELYVYNLHIIETLQAVSARIEGDRLALDLL